MEYKFSHDKYNEYFSLSKAEQICNTNPNIKTIIIPNEDYISLRNDISYLYNHNIIDKDYYNGIGFQYHMLDKNTLLYKTILIKPLAYVKSDEHTQD
jgi:hypothetical protein